jgi:hypothetical protein
MDTSDRFTIIRTRRDKKPETISTGLSGEEAKRWLTQKAKETGASLQDDLIVPPTAASGDAWQAVKAE